MMAVVILAMTLAGEGCPNWEQQGDGLAVAEAVAPAFPDLALQARAEGLFDVCVAVGPDGTPVRAWFQTAGGRSTLFEEVAESAAMRWRFAPQMGPGERFLRLRFGFKLHPLTGLCVGRGGTIESVTFRPPYEVEVNRCLGQLVSARETQVPRHLERERRPTSG